MKLAKAMTNAIGVCDVGDIDEVFDEFAYHMKTTAEWKDGELQFFSFTDNSFVVVYHPDHPDLGPAQISAFDSAQAFMNTDLKSAALTSKFARELLDAQRVMISQLQEETNDETR